MKNIFLIPLIFVCSAMWATAQKQIDLSQRVAIGEPIPPMHPFTALHTGGVPVSVNASLDKIILLDFFDTYCVNCIASLPKLQKLQGEFGDSLQIVLVSWQDSAVLQRFWNTNPTVTENGIQLPIIYGDTLLRKYFPHQGIPHVAWLYQNKLQAVTHSDFVDHTALSKLARDRKIKLPVKNDFVNLDSQVETPTSKLQGSVVLEGFRDATPSAGYSYLQDTITDLFRTTFVNMPISGAYTAIWSKIKKPDFLMKNERYVWLVEDSIRYKNFGTAGNSQRWLAENAICYARYDRNHRREEDQARAVLNDLNGFLGLNVYWSTRKMPCVVISGKFKKQGAEGEGQKMEGTGVLAFLIDYSDKYPPVVDNVKTKETMVIPEFESIAELDRYLKRYGLRAQLQEEEIEVLVFEEIL
ncbi:redoxin domain-containing protein [Sphingobacterium alkalisoli]|uniref:Redoxin domain-containing protein n=1 Tax=Sphingobacterium alkalisoli TaxID=1874115 RepID=A0A4V5LYI4_9SPHI|nr:redoxin domain-containing protein [Sphingobacterium alkalisoli]TJY66719.1 redoxin domain-containing protein [Sphingobacterium alkalisoli]